MYSGPRQLPLNRELVERGRKKRVAIRVEQQVQASRRDALQRQIQRHEAQLEQLDRRRKRQPTLRLSLGQKLERQALEEGLSAMKAELQQCDRRGHAAPLSGLELDALQQVEEARRWELERQQRTRQAREYGSRAHNAVERRLVHAVLSKVKRLEEEPSSVSVVRAEAGDAAPPCLPTPTPPPLITTEPAASGPSGAELITVADLQPFNADERRILRGIHAARRPPTSISDDPPATPLPSQPHRSPAARARPASAPLRQPNCYRVLPMPSTDTVDWTSCGLGPTALRRCPSSRPSSAPVGRSSAPVLEPCSAPSCATEQRHSDGSIDAPHQRPVDVLDLIDRNLLADHAVVCGNRRAVDLAKCGRLKAAQVLLLESEAITRTEDVRHTFSSRDRRLQLRAATFANLGGVRRMQGQPQNAVQCLRAALDVQHQRAVPSPVVLINLSAALLDCSLCEEALRYAKGALQCLQAATPILPATLPGNWQRLLDGGCSDQWADEGEPPAPGCCWCPPPEVGLAAMHCWEDTEGQAEADGPLVHSSDVDGMAVAMQLKAQTVAAWYNVAVAQRSGGTKDRQSTGSALLTALILAAQGLGQTHPTTLAIRMALIDFDLCDAAPYLAVDRHKEAC
eukprot:GGOE01022486.1.p1 GENE.GGOE01022486.1~~GGOE01022486.1.p1  ORF type:complete len:626 (+),score=137.55 GGOE01022486.1:60-1937(+)